MFRYSKIPPEKRNSVMRGNKILREISELEDKPQTGDVRRKLKHLWKQFNEVFDFVFEK